jgi:serine/threonine protein kinase
MSQHPTKEELSGFLLGKLAAPASDVVAEHIDACPPCQNTLSELSSQNDTLLKGLQKPAPSEVDSVGREVVKEVAAKAPRTTPAATPPAPKPQSPLKQAEQPQPSQMGTSGGTVISRDAFRTSLISSGIYDADDLAELERKHPPVLQAADGRELARALVQCGALSKYQASAVYQGKLKGLVYGEYAVVDLLGEGGMGQVFKARHRSMDRIVALKVLAKAAVGSPDAVKRFQREVKAAAKLIHPNIVTAFDASKHDGTHYLVMEFVPGSDLSAVVKKQGPLPIAQAVNYVLQAARGLAFAHSKGVVHRDIKPANLLVDGEGVVKILDMGLARLELEGADAGAGHGLTQTGQIMGTVDYMAPEQAFDTSKADAKADVYSLGCTLYRLLTGGNVFGGDTLMQKLLAHREQPTPSLRTVRPEVSAELDAIFSRMMAKQPQDRPTMTELIAELEALDRGEPTAAFVPTSIAKDSQSGSLFAVKPITTVGKQEPQNTISLVTPAVKPAGRGKKPPTNRLVIGAAAAGAAALCLWGIIVQFKDKDGKVIAEASAPNAASASVVVTPNVGDSSATSGLSPTDSGLPKIDYALERKVAQWLYDHGIMPVLDVAGNKVKLKAGAPLPTEPFVVASLQPDYRQPIVIPRDELVSGLVDFRRLSRFQESNLPHLNGDLWAEAFAALPTVTGVNAAYSDWTDAGVAHVARLPKLHYINLGNCPNITGRGLAALRASSSLEIVEVDEKQVAAGKYTLAEIQQLQDALPKTRVMYAGFRPIPGLKPAGSRTVSGGSSSPASIATARWPYDPPDGREYVWSAPENLGPGVNGKSRDMCPRLTDDELTLIFIRDFQLFTARRSRRDEPFAAAERLAGKFEDLKCEESSITGDGLELYLSNTGVSRHVWMAKRAAIDQPFGDPVRLAPPVNVTDENLSPTVSSDGLTLATYSARGELQIATRFFERGTRSEPFREAAPFRRCAGLERGRVDPVWLSTDGRVLLTTVMHGDSWPHYWHVRASTAEQFSPGIPFGEPFVGNVAPGRAWVSPDGQRMYFHSREVPGGRGDLDLWMVRRVPKPGTTAARWPYDPADGREYAWSAPENLGPGVNYRLRDLHPRLTDDELTVIFYRDPQLMMARRKHRDEPFGSCEPLVGKVQDLKSEGMSITGDGLELFLYNTVGSHDVWSAKRSSLDEPFGDPIRLGPPVNSPQDDQYPTISSDGLSLFVTSVRSDMPRTAIQDVFLFQRKSRTEPFSGPTFLGRDVNPQNMIVSSWISSDLRILLTTVIKPVPWLYHWHSRPAIDEPFSAGTPINMSLTGPIVTGSPWVSPDGMRMYFHSREIPGGQGDLDLWMVRRVPKPGTAAATAPPAAGKLFMHDPAFPQWLQGVQALPVERQIEEVRKKLVELNPGFDGTLWGYNPDKPIVIRDGSVTEIGMSAEFISDISPLRALTGLKVLTCTVFRGRSQRFTDLRPVAGMQLSILNVHRTSVCDLSPLRGMKLYDLFMDDTLVSDLTPLVGMPLTKVALDDTPVSDLTPLHGCRTLREAGVEGTKATPEEIAALRQALPQARVITDAPAAPKPSASPTGTK